MNETFYENAPSAVWETIIEMVDTNRPPSRRPEDEPYRKGYHFLKRFKVAVGADRLSLRRDYPTLFNAFMLYNDPHSERWIIEAGLLTDITIEALSEYVAQSKEVIEEYAKYFYNVKPRLKARGYILNQVLSPAFTRGLHQRDYDLMFKTMAYCLGWEIFTDYIDRREMSVATRTALGVGFRDNLMRLGYAATQRLELNNFNAHIVIELCLKMAEIESKQGPTAGREDAMLMMRDLLTNCKMAILPSAKTFSSLDEPRVASQLYGESSLEYVRGAVDPKLLEANSGKAQ